jgi:hypothetical protein
MMMTLPTGREPITNRQLVQYAALVLLGVLVVQGYTALLADSRITALTAVLLLVVAAYALVFTARHRTSLRIRACASLTVHLITYALVVGSFWVHAALLLLAGQRESLDAGWSGPVLSMSVLWGIGLAVHAWGALRTRGYDDVAV